ncbi:MAG TPA: hypothetical protein VGD36_09050 [Xanthobacteraceae bacterium]|jgi:hypothetical protein
MPMPKQTGPAQPRRNAGTSELNQRDGEKPGGAPPAGPHAKPSQTNPDATPGAGTLPDRKPGKDVDPGAG